MTTGPKKSPRATKGKPRSKAGDEAAKRSPIEVPEDDRDSVDRIRDILFGTQARQFEKQFISMGETLSKELGRLRDQADKNLEALGSRTKKDLDALGQELKAEQTERTGSVSDLSRKLDKAQKDLDKKLTQLADQSKERHADLQKQLAEQIKGLRKDLEKRDEEMTSRLRDAIGRLTLHKTDRLGLAMIFADVASRLKEGLEDS
jgi:uncharacterized phage infection (PIP) family protein YhgE